LIEPRMNVPYSLDAIRADNDDWRLSFEWPVPLPDSLELVERVFERFAHYVLQQPLELRNILLLGRGLNEVVAILEAAFAVQNEEAGNVRLVGAPELEILRGTSRDIQKDVRTTVSMGDRFLKFDVMLPWLRRAVRTASWTPLSRLPRTLIAPDGVAITHNELLRDYLGKGTDAIKFRHAVPYISELVDQGNRQAPRSAEDLEEVTTEFVHMLTEEPTLNGAMQARVRHLVRPIVEQSIGEAAVILSALAAAENVPKLLLTGNGGFYPARALGIEVLNRGGRVVRADHGGTAALMAKPYFFAQQELLVSSEFLVPTRAVQETKVISDALDLVRPVHDVQVRACCGDRSLNPKGYPSQSRGSADRKRRVMFVGTAYYGFSQTYPPFWPGPVYLDWHHRILSQLAGLPIDLVHKPHPGGFFNGCPPGLEKYAPVLNDSFEAEMSSVDVFVFDIAASTTFSTALSSDRPIVLLDSGSLQFNETVAPDIHRRCRVLKLGYDARNRPYVRDDELVDAVCGGPDRIDPSAFRKLYLGDYA
jgi:hypothetical protein